MPNSAAATHTFFNQYPAKHVADRTEFDVAPGTAYYIESGEVRMYTISPETGNALTLHVFRPGSFFPLFSLLSDRDSQFFFETRTQTVLRPAPFSKVKAFLLEHPDDLFALTSRLASGLERLAGRLELVSFTDVYGRVMAAFLYLARHHGQPVDGGVDVGRVTHQELSEFVGATREATSLAIEHLVRDGLIATKKHELIVRDLPALTAAFAKRANHKHSR